MSEGPHSSGTAAQSAGFDRRQFLTAAGVVGGSFLAGAGTTALLSDCIDTAGGTGGKPVKIGAVYGASGMTDALDPGLGRASVAAATLAVDVLNDEGGIDGRTVELEVRDYGSDPRQTVGNLVREFGADAMIGLTSSGVALETAPTIEGLGVPFILTDIGTPYVTEWDADSYGDYYESGDGRAAGKHNVFRTNANTSTNTYAMASFARENLDVSRVAYLGPDSVYGHQVWAYFRAYANGLGADYDYVAEAFPAPGTGDMATEIEAVADADPDLVVTAFWSGDAVTFVRQATERGLFDQVDDVFDTLGADPRVFETLGDTMPEGIHYSTWYWHSAFDNRYNDRLLEAWEKEYRLTYRVQAESNVIGIPPFAGGSTWAALFLYKQAIEAAGGTDPDDIIAELEGASFRQDPRGPVTIDAESHQATAPMVIGETSRDDDVPYDGVGLEPSQTYTLDRSTAKTLLGGSGLPPGV
jgi:branched-chain amino acid transport system substrate-binding protein